MTEMLHICLYQAGVLFDVDGVLLRGGKVIPAARRAFQKLVDRNNNFLLPVVFVTNAGSCQRHHKAQQLSNLLDVQVRQTDGGQSDAYAMELFCCAMIGLSQLCYLSVFL